MFILKLKKKKTVQNLSHVDETKLKEKKRIISCNISKRRKGKRRRRRGSWERENKWVEI